MTGPSRDWIVTRGRLRRRPGSTIYGDTLTAGHETDGILETAIGFLARRIYAALLASMVDLFPTTLVLFTEEATTGAGTIAYYSTNGTDAWHVLGDGFDGTSYPASGKIAHRVFPMVYENTYGGLTLHRLTNATDRQYACAGSRSLLLGPGGQICWGGYDSAPMRWNGRFGAAATAATDDDCMEIYPLGLIPPLQMPVVTAGTSLGASVQGPFKGSEAWFHTLAFEDEHGELSMFTIPRPPGSAWSGYEGFGYFQVDSANPTFFYDSVLYSAIPDGPPGTVFKRLGRSTKVDIAATGAGAVVAPSTADIQWFARIPQGVHTYVDTDGNDLALDPDPRIQEMFRGGGLQWAPCARHIGRFDGHTTLGGLKPRKYAMLFAPWENGAINAGIGDASLYVTVYGVAITPHHILLRKVGATSVTKVGNTVTGSPIVGLPDLRNVETGKTITGTNIPGGTTISSLAPLVDTACTTAAGSVSVEVTNSANNRIGQLVEGPGIQVGSTVVTRPDATHVTISLPATAAAAAQTLIFAQATLSANCTATATGITFTIAADAVDSAYAIAGETLRSLVDRINADASITNTTFTGATWAAGAQLGGVGVIDLGAVTTGVYIGDKVVSGAFPASTIVVGFGSGNNIFVSQPATRANSGGSEAVTIQHRTAAASVTYAAGVVPGADADEQADELLRTLVQAIATYTSTDTTLDLNDSRLAASITPGMLVSGSNIPANTYVTAVNTTLGRITISNASSGSGTNVLVTFYYDTGDETSTTDKGYVRMFGNALPAPACWRKAYLDRFKPQLGSMQFSAASPGYAQDGVNTWLARNKRTAPDAFGVLMGMADLGPSEVHFHSRARMLLHNPRSGETHNDADYTKKTTSWTVGSCSPYAICAGTGFAIAVGNEGFYVTEGKVGDERVFSQAVFDPNAEEGRRGQLEYAIAASIAASESNSDDYKIHASLEGRVLYVRYWSSASAGRPDLEMRYDFSEGGTRDGAAALFRKDGTEWPWSAPCTLAPSCSAIVATAAGRRRFGAFDTNAGTDDGRVDILDTGTEDNGTAIRPVAYTGTLLPQSFEQFQPLRIGIVARKAGTGIVVGVARDSRPDHDEMQFDEVSPESTGGREYGREVMLIASGGRNIRDALTLRITDDGSDECPEITRLTLYGDGQDTIYDKKGGT